MATSQLLAGFGDKAALDIPDFESLLKLHQLRVFRFILASTRDRDVAETLTQDCFWKAYEARLRFRQQCSLETWLMQIAVNLVRDHVRNRRLRFWKRVQQTASSVDDLGNRLSDRKHSPESELVLKEEVQAIWRAAGQLSERQRSVFLLRFVEDMDILEIAAVTGMKEGTVKAHLFRALKTIRERAAPQS